MSQNIKPHSSRGVKLLRSSLLSRCRCSNSQLIRSHRRRGRSGVSAALYCSYDDIASHTAREKSINSRFGGRAIINRRKSGESRMYVLLTIILVSSACASGSIMRGSRARGGYIRQTFDKFSCFKSSLQFPVSSREPYKLA